MRPNNFCLASVCILMWACLCMETKGHAPLALLLDTIPIVQPTVFSDVGIYIANPVVRFENVVVVNKDVGILIDYHIDGNDPQPEIISNRLEMNDTALYIISGDPYVRYNSFANNAEFGAVNDPSNIIVNICENWWGDETGPFHLNINPDGLGTKASDNLIFKGCFLTTIPNPKQLDLQVFLEGAYLGNGQMSSMLTDLQRIPLAQPFSGAPWNYYGNEEAIPMPAAITDWVLVSLRSDAAASSTISTQAALLRNDGIIVGADSRGLYFNQAEGQDSLHIVVYHRNHIGMMSEQRILVANDLLVFDFSMSDTFGGLLGKKNLGDGRFGLIAGDYNANGQVQNSDLNNLLPNLGVGGYDQGDMNLNSQVQNTDVQNFLQPNIGKGAAFEYSY